MVFLVVTHGNSSMDLYSAKLSQYLPVPVVHTDIYQKVCEQYNKPLLSPYTVKSAFLMWRFIKFLHETPDIPHLPNHHLGRFGYFLEKPFIVTVHDLVRYFDMKNYGVLIHKPKLQDTLWLRLDYEGVKKAFKIIAPSHYTKMDIVRYLGIPEERIEVIYHGVDSVFKPRKGSRPCPDPYILYVGSEHPRKNLQTLLKAFSLLKKEPAFKDLKLVKVGRAGGEESKFRDVTLRLINALRLEKDVVIVDRWISEEVLASFYSQAELFAFPSIYEGFGLPPLEAMACGCPVISSSTTSMPEILGDAAIYAHPYDVEGWRLAMFEVLTDDKLRRRLSTQGIRRAQRFNWEKTAELTLKLYREVEAEVKELKPEPLRLSMEQTAYTLSSIQR